MLVSFIIPAYNAADTIVRCLESIYGLSLKRDEFEVIVIDDCSTDETVSIIEDWRLKIENLILLKQSENHRQGAARNQGMKVAKGEYICFVDADDAVTDRIVKAIRIAQEKHVDMMALHYAFADEKGAITSEAQKLSFAQETVFSGIEMQNAQPYWCSAPWGFLYRRAFLQRVNYPFSEDVLYEDTDFVIVHLYHAQRMLYSIDMGYVAYSREGSTTRSMSFKNAADYLLLGVRMLRFYEKCEQMNTQFEEGVLEGACWNVQKSCRRIFKLKNINELRAFYNRVDAMTNRKMLCDDRRIRKYYWDIWTLICLKYCYVTIALYILINPLFRLRCICKK